MSFNNELHILHLYSDFVLLLGLKDLSAVRSEKGKAKKQSSIHKNVKDEFKENQVDEVEVEEDIGPATMKA